MKQRKQKQKKINDNISLPKIIILDDKNYLSYTLNGIPEGYEFKWCLVKVERRTKLDKLNKNNETE
jgi:tRNA uridine 5-carbamoylmethylation protein Kti12